MILTCIHQRVGLCASCRADYEEDPQAWEELGDHPEGLRRLGELLAEIKAAREEVELNPAAFDDGEIPF